MPGPPCQLTTPAHLAEHGVIAQILLGLVWKESVVKPKIYLVLKRISGICHAREFLKLKSIPSDIHHPIPSYFSDIKC